MVPHHAQERSLTPEARPNGTNTARDNGEGTMDNFPLSTLNSPCDAQAWKRPQATGWRAREPRHVHSLKWVDHEGIEHLHVLRSDDLDDVLREMATLKLCIQHARAQAAKKKAQEAADAAPAEANLPAPDPTFCRIHDCWMTEHTNARGNWHSYRLDDGTWCRGKAKKARQ